MTWNLLIGTSWESARTTSTTSRWPTVSTSGATPSTLRPFLETSSPVSCSQREGNCWYSSSQNVRRQRRRWWPLGTRQWPRSSTTRPSPRFGLFLSDRCRGWTNSWLSAEFTGISFLKQTFSMQFFLWIGIGTIWSPHSLIFVSCIYHRESFQ